MTPFKGLPKDFFVFFKELAANNERPWFEENKQRYKDVVLAPLSDFIAAMAPRVGKITKQIVCDPRPNGGSMFRIYRDVRFAKDKSPYKTHAGVHFRHALGRDAHVPGFYMHFAPDEVFFGGGIWMPEPPALNKVRRAIADEPKSWKKVVEDKVFKTTFNGVEGDALSRPPKGFDAEHPYIGDIKRKSFFAMHQSSPKAAASPALLDEVEATFRAAKPLMQFVCKALDAPF
ncbi:MAG: DUF2461 domain-containing protein [Alphaproteobacteria bacterium]|nr:DUF2461 domain-containing protein [Alphaproteobacteria bacterium]